MLHSLSSLGASLPAVDSTIQPSADAASDIVFVTLTVDQKRELDQTEPSNIARLFADNYRELYTNVPYDFNEMQCIIDDISCLLSTERVSSDCIYSCNDVKDAVSHLKAHKSDGNLGLSSDHIINTSDSFLLILLSCLQLLLFMVRGLSAFYSVLLYQFLKAMV